MLQRPLVALLAAIFALAAQLPAGVAAQTLERIRQRGVLVVGTKADYKPFGFRDPTGAIVGFEPDLARDIADRLGVRLQLEPVVSANRMQFLQQGRIDLLLATMNVTDERRRSVGIVAPSYYASGVNVFVNRRVALTRWDGLKGRKVCGIQGTFYNKYVAETYGADIVAFRGQQEAETALQQGACMAWLYDDTAFQERLSDPKWAAYEVPLETILEEPWGAAVKLEERDGPWGRFVSEAIADWHRSGKLIDIEHKWGIQPAAFLRRAREQTP